MSLQASHSGSKRKQRYESSCAAKCHSKSIIAFPGNGRLVSVYDSREFTPDVRQRLTRKGLLPLREGKTRFVCVGCIAYGKAYIAADGSQSESESEDEPESDSHFETTVKMIREDTITESQIESLINEIGIYMQKKIGLNKVKKDSKYDMAMMDSTYMDTWDGMERLLKVFLVAVAGYGSIKDGERFRATRLLCKAAECIHAVVNPKYIPPLSLAENLTMYYYGGSRTACDVFGSTQPAGKHTTLQKAVQRLGSDSPPVPTGDIFIVFDNVQRIGKLYRVVTHGPQPQSVVTSISVFKKGRDFGFQKFAAPNVYVPNAETRNMVYQKFQKFREEGSNVNAKFCQEWIDKCFTHLRCEKEGSASSEWTIKLSRLSDHLHHDQLYSGDDFASVVDMECINVNPNSYSSVTTVLDTVLSLSQTDPQRKNVVCVCDGLPFLTARNIILDTHICSSCCMEVKRKEIKNHGCENPHFKKKYRSIIMRPGNGHFEINMVRGIFKIYFEIFIQPIARQLGFNTFKALEYCKAATDHHKSWQILRIMFEALSLELLHPYFKACEGSEATVEGYTAWKQGVKNPNYQMAADFVYSVLNPLFLFRAAIRLCDDELALYAREKAASIFYDGNHPKYAEINCVDLFYLLSLPDFGSGCIKSQAICMAGSRVGQGLDFQLEERNKLILNWVMTMTEGVPSFEQWRKSTASLHKLEKIRSNVMHNMQVNQAEWKLRSINLSTEVAAARHYFRTSIFIKTEEMPLQRWDGSPIPSQFINSVESCEWNRKRYYTLYLQGEKSKVNPLLTQTFDSLTESELKRLVKTQLTQLRDSEKQNYENILRRQLRKDELIEVYCGLDELISLSDYDEFGFT